MEKRKLIKYFFLSVLFLILGYFVIVFFFNIILPISSILFQVIIFTILILIGITLVLKIKNYKEKQRQIRRQKEMEPLGKYKHRLFKAVTSLEMQEDLNLKIKKIQRQLSKNEKLIRSDISGLPLWDAMKEISFSIIALWIIINSFTFIIIFFLFLWKIIILPNGFIILTLAPLIALSITLVLALIYIAKKKIHNTPIQSLKKQNKKLELDLQILRDSQLRYLKKDEIREQEKKAKQKKLMLLDRKPGIEQKINERKYTEAAKELLVMIEEAKWFDLEDIIQWAGDNLKRIEQAEFTYKYEKQKAIIEKYINEAEYSKAIQELVDMKRSADENKFTGLLKWINQNIELSTIHLIKSIVIELGTKFARLQIVEIMEVCGINDDQLILTTIKKMIEDEEIYAQYFSSTKSVAFNQQAIKKNMEKLRKAISPVIIPEAPKMCVVCRGNIRNLLFECSTCDALYHLKCAKVLEKKGKGCFQCNSKFPPLPELPSEEFRSDQEDPVIISVRKISYKISSLLTPEEINHKDLTSQFSQLKKNLKDELRHKISPEFHNNFEDRIENLFDKISQLRTNDLENLDEIKKEQKEIFKTLNQKLEALESIRDGKLWIDSITQRKRIFCSNCGNEILQNDQVICEVCGIALS